MVKFLTIVSLCVFLTGCQAQHNGQIKGIVIYEKQPVENATVYAYSAPNTNLKEVYIALSAPTDDQGHFSFEVESGSYFLVARMRQNQAITGPLTIGDFRGSYNNNPCQVDGNTVDVGKIEVNKIISDRNSKLQANAGVISGQVSGSNLDHAYIYVYPFNSDIRGPAYEVALPISEDGSYKFKLNPGKYSVLIRARQSGNVRGPVAKADLIGQSDNNPITVKANQVIKLAPIILKNPDQALWQEVQDGKIISETKTAIQGLIVDSKKQPVSKVFAFLYAQDQVVGKPLAKSNFTNDSGRYAIYLTEGGTYYLGARGSLGGPLEPGDWVGSYEDNPEHLIKIETGKTLEGINIIVEPFRE